MGGVLKGPKYPEVILGMVPKINVVGQWEKNHDYCNGGSHTVGPGLEQILPFDNFSSYAVIGLFDKNLGHRGLLVRVRVGGSCAVRGGQCPVWEPNMEGWWHTGSALQ